MPFVSIKKNSNRQRCSRLSRSAVNYHNLAASHLIDVAQSFDDVVWELQQKEVSMQSVFHCAL